MSVVRYRIDSQDTILDVNDAWTAFAIENGAPELGAAAVVGQSMWRYIDGSETQHLWGMLLARARQTLRTHVFPFRCDAPTCRRHMEMAITGSPDGSVDFVSKLLREEPRSSVPLLESRQRRGESWLTICSWCNRVHVAEAEWSEVETAVERLALFSSDGLPQVTHGICRACHATVLREWSAMAEDAKP